MAMALSTATCRGYGRTMCRNLCTRRKLTNAEVRKKRSELFGREKARQAALITRIEKIKVEYKGTPEECSLLMNKGLSTPFNCAMHIHELFINRSVVALVNGEPWDMHKPLTEDCEVDFLHFKDSDPSLSNEAFWRSGSFIMGHVLETAFKDEFYVELCSFPKPDIKSGSFVYDADLSLPDWNPTNAELQCMSRIGSRLANEDIMFERLEMDASVAEKIFEDNRFKSEQIPSIAAQSRLGSTVTVYRMGDHVDISRGPLIPTTSLLWRFSITKVHQLTSPDYGSLQRVQGLAIPRQLPMHYWAYNILEERSRNLNPAPVPTSPKVSPVIAEQNS